MTERRPLRPGLKAWQVELLYLTFLALSGAAASYLSVRIPYTDVYIEGRWIFGFIGFALLPHWWTALLLAAILSIAHVGTLPVGTIFVGNMLYAVPTLLLIRTVHARLLVRIRSSVGYGLAWFAMVLLCYQLGTPLIWGFAAFLDGEPIWPQVLAAWRDQPFLFESFLVGLISALAMVVIRTNAALRAGRQELATTLYSIGDAVISTDLEGRIRRMNPVAERLTGWLETEAVGKPLTEVFHIVQEATREPVADPAAEVLRRGAIVGLANHTLLIAKDGTEVPIADSGAPIFDAQSEIRGVVLTFRDQSEERLHRRLVETRLSLIEYGTDHDVDEILQKALDEVGAFVESPLGFCHFAEADGKTLSLRQWSTSTQKDFCRVERPSGDDMHYDIGLAGVWVDCVYARRPVIHNDYASLENKKGMPEGHPDVIRELVVPVMRDGQVVAILGVGNKPTPYGEEDAELVSYLADVTWEIVQQKRAEAEREVALEALRQERDRAQMYLDIAGVIIVALNAQGEVTLINQKGCEILGCGQEEVLGKHWFRHFVPASRRVPTTVAFGRLIAGEIEAAEYYENPILTAVGETRVIAWHNTLLRTDEGDVVGTLSSGEDITERRRTEAQRRAAVRALRESEEKYRLLAETTRDVIILHDLQGRILYVNRAGLEFTGLERSEAMSGSVRDFVPDAYVDDLTERQVRRAAGDAGTYRYEIEFQNADGARIPMEVNSTGVAQEGRVSQVLVVARDITERRRAERERARLTTRLREQARQTEQILTTVPAGVLLLDGGGRILQANPTAERDLARLTGAGVGDTITYLGDRALTELLTSPPTRGLWHEITSEDRIFEAIARPVASTSLSEQPPHVQGSAAEQWVLVLNDVTREREIQAQLQQQEKLAAVGQLAAGIAHDFNNVMATIVLYAQMAARSQEISTQNRERMSVINQQAWHATRLIEQILDFSRRSMLEKRALNLVPLLKEHVKLLERTLPEDIEISFAYEPGECTLDVDPTRMQQMLTNLAVNARDAMMDGGLFSIELDWFDIEPGEFPWPSSGASVWGETPPLSPPAGRWVRLTVTDTGSGIPQETLPRIFEPFFTTKAPGQGSGLGLPQVQGIVAQHGGYINVRSREGEGTVVTLYLPASDDAQSGDRAAPDVVAMPLGNQETILVVEDDPSVRAALVAGLSQLNYTVVPAENGETALEIISTESTSIDLVLSDVVMPAMGGIALMHTLQARGWEIPVILLTGHPLDRELEGLREAGLAAWMSKPPRLERLAQMIHEVLRSA